MDTEAKNIQNSYTVRVYVISVNVVIVADTYSFTIVWDSTVTIMPETPRCLSQISDVCQS